MPNTQIPVCIFAKPPLPGQVKTRLTPVLSPETAASLASATLLDTWNTVAQNPTFHSILATTKTGQFPMSVPTADLWLQGEGDLGQRIERILTRALADAPAAIALGADSPALTAAHLEGAVQAIQTTDAALGPSLDGGFYLLALRRCPPGLLENLPWSAPHTLAAVTERLHRHGFTITTLAPLFDIDTPSDLQILYEYLSTCAMPVPATRAWCLENNFPQTCA